MSDPLDPLDLEALEAAARARLDQGVYDYIAGGADAELSVAGNLAAWSRLRLRPRVLRDVARVSTATSLLGSEVPVPLAVAPMAYHRMTHPEGEAASAAGAAAAGALYLLSTQATMSVEEVADAAPEAVRWFQVYVVRDRGWTAELVGRAAAAGYRALVLTVDVPLLGNRLRDLRNDFRLPTGLAPANAPPSGAARQRELAVDVLAQAGQFDPGLTPETIGWLAERSGLPVVVKGVLRADDALACVEAGAAGVVVSNHGGRQLDSVVATADALAEVAAAVGDRAEVYVDGGIRRGTDVLKALALGARAALIGRPVLWGLTMAGAKGVERVLSGLAGELRLAMALCGATTIAQLTPDLVAGHAPPRYGHVGPPGGGA
ncbi:MAG TPA: alpha-hydroxy acid oxidase [Actinomycetota bacterium]|nr:alpha-hydroxy acid oxidase [Actinomycetota bacterium]